MSRLSNIESIIKSLPYFIQHDTLLRESQVDVFNQLLSYTDPPQKGLWELATGFGKTRLMCILALSYLTQNPNGKCVIVVPTQTLIKDETGNGIKKHLQDYNTRFSDTPLSIGNYYSREKNTTAQVIVTTYDSLVSLAEKIDVNQVGLLLLDEVHHALSDRRMGAIQKFTQAVQYGLTATPYYSQEKSALNFLNTLIAQFDVVKSIKCNDLAEVKNILMVSKVKADLSKVKKNSQGDYDIDEYYQALANALVGKKANSSNPQNWHNIHERIAYDIARFYQTHIDENIGALNGKKCLINCRSQEEARIQAQVLNQLFQKEVAGIWTIDHQQKGTLERFVNGDLPILCQVGKLSEGFDMPHLDIVINYPTSSYVLEAQRSGRVLRKPVNSDKKMGLVVDIAFMHPDSDNIVDSVHKNRQVLYQDVLESPIVLNQRNKDEAFFERKAPMETQPKDFQALDFFQVVSDTQELIRIRNEALQILSNETINAIRPNMMSANIMSQQYHISAQKALDLLRQYQDKTFVDLETQTQTPFVEVVKNKGSVCLALTDNEYGIHLFEQENQAYLNANLFQKGMLTRYDLVEKYQIGYRVADSLFKKYQDKTFLNPETNQQESCIITIKKRGRLTQALNNNTHFISLFENENNAILFKNPYQEKMLNAQDISNKYHLYYKSAILLLKKYQHKTYFNPQTKQQEPFVFLIRRNGQFCLALTCDSYGIELFENQNKKLLNINRLRPNMLTSTDIAKRYKLSPTLSAKLLTQAQNQTFYDPQTQQTLPLVEEIKHFGRDCLALNESPVALQVFEELNQTLLKTPLIQEGMLTSTKLAKHYHISPETAIKIFKDYQGKTYFNPQTHQTLPFLITVKVKGTICDALTNDPFGVRLFLKQNPILLKKLKEFNDKTR